MSKKYTLVPGLCLLVLIGVFVALFGLQPERADAEAMPFMRIRLKNVSPPGGPPATAQVEATGTKQIGPVAPGDETEVTHKVDTVNISVTVGGTFTGSGSYPGSSITDVDIDCTPAGCTATVKFEDGAPPQQIPLTP